MKLTDARDCILRKLDYSTIRLDVLRQQPRYVKPGDYTFSLTPGIACFGNPPGHPKYFLWKVTSPGGYGLNPDDTHGPGVWITNMDDPRMKASPLKPVRCSPEYPCFLHGDVIADPDDFSVGYIVFSPIYPSLYQPLLEDHPRVQAWLQLVYARMSPDNRELTDIWKWYPDHSIRFEWLTHRPPLPPSDWWEVFATNSLSVQDIAVEAANLYRYPEDRNAYLRWWKWRSRRKER